MHTKVSWNKDLAYAVGLITTDGCLSKDGRHIDLTSKDLEQINNFKEILNLNNKIGIKYRGPDHTTTYNRIQFGNVKFYKWLIEIGLTPAKSKTIGKLKIPENYFADFLRGCLDGDGTISITHHPESKFLQLRVQFCSASPKFLLWLKTEIRNIFNITGGYIEKKERVLVLSFGKIDSMKILDFIYHNKVKYALTRKKNIYKKIKGEWRNWHTRTI